MAQRELIDDLLDARQEARRLHKEILEKRVTLRKSPAFLALKRVKDELKALRDSTENVWSAIEEKQGRLPFMEEAAPSVPVLNGKKKPRRDAPGPRA
jgi:hypothetical protein